jgi:predicted Zn-dependent protease
MVNALLNSGYSQEQELAADSLALFLLSSAGYEPKSLVEVLTVLEKNKGSNPTGLYRTHPAPALRIYNAEKELARRSPGSAREYRIPRFNGTKKASN